MKIALSCLALLLLPSMAAAADPVPVPRPIFFASGSESGTVGGRVQRGHYDLYSLMADAGQRMIVSITTPDNNAFFQVYAPGTAVSRGADGTLEFSVKPLNTPGVGGDTARWAGRLPARGTYIFAIGSKRGNAGYSMDVTIE